MMKKNYLLPLILIAILLAGAYLLLIFFSGQSRQPVANNIPDQSDGTASILSIARINQGQAGDQPYQVRAYVVKITPCPPCPEGSVCKPCMPDNIVISDSNITLTVFPETLPQTDLIVFVDLPGGLANLRLGRKYSFSLIKSEDKFYNDEPAYQLVSFAPAE